eukprot:SAG31_NODE_16292_length_715_cov_0.667208_1_plen_197_part_01
MLRLLQLLHAGFTHQPRGLYAQMVLGESFEGLNLSSSDAFLDGSRAPAPTPPGSSRNPWARFAAQSARATVSIDHAVGFHGHASLALAYAGGAGAAGVANRGLAHEGLVFEPQKSYEGYFFATAATPVIFTVSLYDYVRHITLASASIEFRGGNWSQLHFDLSTSGGTNCSIVNASLSPPDPDVTCGPGLCVKCAGE